MSILVIVEHDNQAVNVATLNTVAAAKEIGGDLHLLVAGENCGSVASAAAALDGAGKVLCADSAEYGHNLAGNLAPLVSGIAGDYSWIARLQRDVDNSATLQEQMELAHEAHKRLRETFMSEAERILLTDRGMMSALSDRGIGGIKEPGRIRCFHTWYAAHMVEANCIGLAVDQLMASAEDFEWRLG